MKKGLLECCVDSVESAVYAQMAAYTIRKLSGTGDWQESPLQGHYIRK